MKYKHLLECSPICFIQIDVEEVILFANPAFCTFLGYSQDELFSKRISDLIYPADIEESNNSLLAIRNGEIDQYRIENRYVHKSGEIKWGDLFAKLIPSELNESSDTILATIIDITNLKEKQTFPNREKLDFKTMFVNNPQAMGIYSTKTFELLEVNESATRLYGYSREEFLKLTVSDLLADEDKSEFFKFLSKDAPNLTKSKEWKVITKSGEKRIIEATSHLIQFKGIPARHVIVIDMTERKRAEVNQLIFSSAIEQNPISIVITDTNGIIKYVNPKFTEVTGYHASEVIGKNPRLLKSNKMESQFYKDLWSIISSGNIWNGEFINKKKNGDFYLEDKLISPVKDSSGSIINYLSIGEDITHLKKIELDLKKAKKKTEESSRLKSVFLSIISHELRTPLNSIIGFSELLLKNSEDKLIKDMAGYIHKSGYDMLNLLEDLFDLSFYQGQKVKCNLKSVYCIDLYSMAWAYLEEILINSGKYDRIHIISQNLTRNLNSELNIDQAKVLQVLSILFKNAVKFTQQGDIEFGSEINEDLDKIRLFVRDTGIGIEEKKIKVIFNLFQQANEGLSRPYEGLGIGLAIAKQLVNIMGGTIEVESQLGKGSTFSFTLPVNIKFLEKISSPDMFIPEENFRELNGMTILVVDDNPLIHEIIRHQLKKFEIRILTAKNGVEALLLLKDQIPDLILMDLIMPVMDGFETTRCIRSLYTNIPIIALTAHSFSKDKQRAREAGCDKILTKPISSDILLYALKECLIPQNVHNKIFN